MIKDLHSHILYGIDDGSKTIEESIVLLKKMEKAGTKELILTPHYIENSKYNANNRSKEALFRQLKKKAKEEKINIDLYLGNEVFFSNNMIELIKKGEIKTLNKSKYLLFEFPMTRFYNNSLEVIILFEFPMTRFYNNSLEVINQLVSNGYIPVLAHPERYTEFQKNPSLVIEYLKSGVLLQGNFTSLFGKYGRHSRKVLKLYLKNKWITFIGSDAHHEVAYDNKKLEKMLLKITKDKEYTEELLSKNFDKVINNEDIGIII